MLGIFERGKWKSLSCVQLFGPHGLYSPWNSPGQNTGVGNLSLFQGIFPTQGLEPRSPALQEDSLPAEPQGSPRILEWVAYPFSRGSSQPRNWTRVSCIAGRFFTNWAIREANKTQIPVWVHVSLNVTIHGHWIPGRRASCALSSFLVCSLWEEVATSWASQWLCGKESACNAGDTGSIPRSGRFLEEGMATHSSILAWRISWTEEPSGLQSMESQRVGYDWSDWVCTEQLPRCPTGHSILTEEKSCFKGKLMLLILSLLL